MCRLSNRSAKTPPYAPSNSTGRKYSATLVPSAVPLSVSSSTSHAEAVKFIHMPMAEIVWPVRYRRKLRDSRSDEMVRERAALAREVTLRW